MNIHTETYIEPASYDAKEERYLMRVPLQGTTLATEGLSFYDLRLPPPPPLPSPCPCPPGKLLLFSIDILQYAVTRKIILSEPCIGRICDMKTIAVYSFEL